MIEDLERRVEQELAAAVAFARSSPEPQPEQALEDVYCEGERLV